MTARIFFVLVDSDSIADLLNANFQRCFPDAEPDDLFVIISVAGSGSLLLSGVSFDYLITNDIAWPDVEGIEAQIDGKSLGKFVAEFFYGSVAVGNSRDCVVPNFFVNWDRFPHLRLELSTLLNVSIPADSTQLVLKRGKKIKSQLSSLWTQGATRCRAAYISFRDYQGVVFIGMITLCMSIFIVMMLSNFPQQDTFQSRTEAVSNFPYGLGDKGWDDDLFTRCSDDEHLVAAGREGDDFITLCEYGGSDSLIYRANVGSGTLQRSTVQLIDAAGSVGFQIDASPATIFVYEDRLEVWDGGELVRTISFSSSWFNVNN